MIYSFAILAFSRIRRLGSTEVGVVVSFCACRMNAEKSRVVKQKAVLNKIWDFVSKLEMGNIESDFVKEKSTHINEQRTFMTYLITDSICSLVFPNLRSLFW